MGGARRKLLDTDSPVCSATYEGCVFRRIKLNQSQTSSYRCFLLLKNVLLL